MSVITYTGTESPDSNVITHKPRFNIKYECAPAHPPRAGAARAPAPSQANTVTFPLGVSWMPTPCDARSASPSSATSLQPWNMQKPISWRSR